MPMVKRKKKKLPATRRTGVSAAPFEKGIIAVQSYFQFEVDRKDSISVFKSYAKSVCTKKEMQQLSACPDYKFWNASHHCGTCAYLLNVPKKEEVDEKLVYWERALAKYIEQLIEVGKKIIEEKSNGELSLQLFPSAQLFKDKEVPEAVGSGAIRLLCVLSI